MSIYAPAIMFIASCIAYSGYSFLSITHRCSTTWWHVFQYVSVAAFIYTGWMIGKVIWSWHDFGNMAAVAVIGVPVYIIVLRLLTKWYK